MNRQTFMTPHIERNGNPLDSDKRFCFDMESESWTNIIAIGCYHGQSDSYRTWTKDETENPVSDFLDWILQPAHSSHRFVAHNGGKFDFGFLLDELEKRSDCEIEVLDRNGSAIWTKIYYYGERESPYVIHLQDSMALMPQSLAECSKAFGGIEKSDFDYELLDTPESMKQNGDWVDMLEYLRIDCTCLDSALSGFVEKTSEIIPGNDTLSPGITIASTTMSIYQQYFMDQSIAHCSNEAESKIREAYFGGRTEVFRHSHDFQHGKLNHYDINSLYPYIYGTKPHPIGRETHTENPDLSDLDRSTIGGVVKISGLVPEDTHIPVLPKEEEINKTSKIIFPTGHISGWYSIAEVLYAQEVGALKDIECKESFTYAVGCPFDAFTDKLYSLKNEIDSANNPGKYRIVKLLLNSFYGKFAQQREQTTIVFTSDPPPEGKPFGSSIYQRQRSREIGIYEIPDTSEANYIIPQIAVSITAKARIELHKWIRKAKAKGGKIWYCDTDSIATDIELPESEDLGGMDLEVISDESYFVSPKVYAESHADSCPCCCGDRTTKKGKGMKSQELDEEISFADYRTAIQEQDPSVIGVSWETPSNPRSIIGNERGMHKKEMNRSVKNLDDKRNHDIDDNTSIPLSLDTIEKERMKQEAGNRKYDQLTDRLAKAFKDNFYGDEAPYEYDNKAKRDSELYASEAKKQIEKGRKMKGKDLKQRIDNQRNQP